MAFEKICSAAVYGIDASLISVEVDISDGLPVVEMVGMLSPEVREARERVKTALKNNGFQIPAKRITINLSPGNLKKSGCGFDLPIAMGIFLSIHGSGKGGPGGQGGSGAQGGPGGQDLFFVGELSLSGEVLPVKGVLPMMVAASREGIRAAVVPLQNGGEASLVPGIEIICVEHLREAVEYVLQGTGRHWDREQGKPRPATEGASFDFADLNGQPVLRRALEVAASGRHNVLMIGPPGAGKTMAAKCIPSILPPMTGDECLEISKIYSVIGKMEGKSSLLQERPFRAPHHTISANALTGGGTVPRPGEISLAHKGVLFLDELPEFDRKAIEILRQPLEEKQIRISRVHSEITFPADFMLVAAMNPCRCGYFPDLGKCRCSREDIRRYLGKISQPLLDRIDICTEAGQIGFSELVCGSGGNEPSAAIRQRVSDAQAVQRRRFAGTGISFNSQIPARSMGEFCPLGQAERCYMERVYERYGLTARTFHKILKVARTIADLAGRKEISVEDLKEAVCYRSVDRKFWEWE